MRFNYEIYNLKRLTNSKKFGKEKNYASVI